MIETSGHLPECTFADNQQPFESYSLYDCICDRLRACEERVFQEQIAGRQYDMVLSYRRGLDAAREAVAAIKDEYIGDKYKYERLALRVALAAIDALRGEQ